MEQTDRPAGDPIGHLVAELSKLPGIGPKSAQRITFHLLRASTDESDLLARAIVSLKQRIKFCSSCYKVTDADPCSTCRSDRRDRSMVCVVEQPQDVLAIEHTGSYHGLYHVLHGAISPTEGVGADITMYWCTFIIASSRSDGAQTQPTRQPVIA